MKSIKNIQGGEAVDQKISDLKIRLIPFSSLGMKNGMLIGVKVDKIIIYYRDREEVVKNVIIGLYENEFTKDNRYNAIIGLDIIEIQSNELSTV